MPKVNLIQAEVDLSAPLVLEFNEITVLMGINAVGIIAIMCLSIYVAASAFLSKSDPGDLPESHFSRG